MKLVHFSALVPAEKVGYLLLVLGEEFQQLAVLPQAPKPTPPAQIAATPKPKARGTADFKTRSEARIRQANIRAKLGTTKTIAEIVDEAFELAHGAPLRRVDLMEIAAQHGYSRSGVENIVRSRLADGTLIQEGTPGKVTYREAGSTPPPSTPANIAPATPVFANTGRDLIINALQDGPKSAAALSAVFSNRGKSHLYARLNDCMKRNLIERIAPGVYQLKAQAEIT
jgi:hypothetical protein